MKVKIIEKTHELDLQDALNDFIKKENPEIIDMHYAVSMTSHQDELEYSFSCMIVYLSEH